MSVNPDLIQDGLKVWAFPGRAQEGLKGVVKSKKPGVYCFPTLTPVRVLKIVKASNR